MGGGVVFSKDPGQLESKSVSVNSVFMQYPHCVSFSSLLSISSREFAISEIAQQADKVRRDQQSGKGRQGGILHLDFAQITKELK